MTNVSNINDASQDSSDQELEELLTDAFDAPPVPRTLLKRLDRGIEQEWGTSPRLADSHVARVGRTLVGGGRWVRRLPIAAALGVLILLAVMFRGDSTAFAWSQLLDAMAKQGVVQLESENVDRWLALSEGWIRDRSDESSVLVDIQRQVVLQRDDGSADIKLRSLKRGAPADRNQLVLTFLSGTNFDDETIQRFSGARVVSESSSRVSGEAGENIQLDVDFVCDNLESVSLRALVDVDSHLPLQMQLVTADLPIARPTLTVSFPAATATDRRAVEFPADMPVVNVEAAEAIQTASLESNLSGADDKLLAPIGTDKEDSNVAVALATTTPASPKPERKSKPAGLFGAASGWQPVDVSQGSNDDVLQQLDHLMAKLWEDNGVDPAEPAGDEELLRRVYLDLAGRIPAVTEVRNYLNDKSPNRYVALVERLLMSADFASHLAATYRRFLIPEGVDLTAFGGVEAFDKWLSERFASNDSYDEVVRSLLLAEGRLSRSGPLLFYSAAKLDPDQLASRTSRVFLGMRLECAQCHDHPFEPWSQKDFWSYAAFFARISRPQGTLENVSTVMRVRDVERGEVMIPDSDEVVPPRFLNSAAPVDDGQADQRRQKLAKWLTGADNPYFPRAAANRVWGQMFGRGIVDPVDDFGVENPPVSPEVLDLLAGHFIRTKFDLRELFRTIALSRAYRLSSGADVQDYLRVNMFAQMNVKTLTAEQVYDCITVATMPSGAATEGFNVVRFGNTPRDEFLRQFRTPSGRQTEYLGGIPQALTLMNGTLIDGATGLASSGLLKSLAAPFFQNKQRIEILYFATLSRQPTASEWELLNEYISEDLSGPALQEGLADVLWAVLNSAEFTMNH
ncbi:DUF1549 and DUF1553 domain-containing protein [Fuerstiella marisgermanici]|uniref:Cytochrome c domain-containing protein n=1 Tax=Fuerstiella marisgermanici TaxID=1891926 RepID=A0A1P8WFW5_9PLAN|nr:DUF1549 and DUF1553 domain-containing protein [Fuerstiella marisgermanici]APZ92956.1 hypothetical protein Fuma_02568 [Fuerstiella marisgermanici]